MMYKDGAYLFEDLAEVMYVHRKEKQLNKELETRLSELSVYEGILRNRLASLIDILQQELVDIESRISALPNLHSTLLYEEGLATELPYILSEEASHLSLMKSKLEQMKSEIDKEISYKTLLDAKSIMNTGFDIARKLKPLNQPDITQIPAPKNETKKK